MQEATVSCIRVQVHACASQDFQTCVERCWPVRDETFKRNKSNATLCMHKRVMHERGRVTHEFSYVRSRAKVCSVMHERAHACLHTRPYRTMCEKSQTNMQPPLQCIAICRASVQPSIDSNASVRQKTSYP